jgi:ParB-like chromosome segregation protein Spo0J
MAALRRRQLAKSDSRAHARARDIKEGDPAAFWVRRDSLKPWKRNPRDNMAAVDEVVESIKEFGFGAPIVARKSDKEILAGHTRLLAAEVLGMELVPVRWMELDLPKGHLYALADNKLGEIAKWADEELANILSEYSLEDAKLAGFNEAELDKLAAKFDDGEIEVLAIEQQFSIIIECPTEQAQVELLEQLQAQGHKCRALI